MSIPTSSIRSSPTSPESASCSGARRACGVFLTDELAVTKTFEVDRTQQDTVDVIQNVTETVTEEISVTQDTAQDTTFSSGVAGDVTITDSISKTMSESVELDFTKEQSIENRKILTEIESIRGGPDDLRERRPDQVYGGNRESGECRLPGCDPCSLAVIPDPSHPGKFLPIANLVPDTVDPFYDPYPPYALPPGARFPAVVYVNATLDLKAAKQLLRDAKSIIITVAGLELLDENGVPFAFKIPGYRIKDRPDRHRLRRTPQSRAVPCRDERRPAASPASRRARALRDILRIPFEAGPID